MTQKDDLRAFALAQKQREPEQERRTIWRGKDEFPEDDMNLVYISVENTDHIGHSTENGNVDIYNDENPFTGKSLPQMVKWCYLSDLLKCERDLTHIKKAWEGSGKCPCCEYDHVELDKCARRLANSNIAMEKELSELQNDYAALEQILASECKLKGFLDKNRLALRDKLAIASDYFKKIMGAPSFMRAKLAEEGLFKINGTERKRND